MGVLIMRFVLLFSLWLVAVTADKTMENLTKVPFCQEIGTMKVPAVYRAESFDYDAVKKEMDDFNAGIQKVIDEVPKRPEVLTLDQLGEQFGSQLVEKFNQIKYHILY